MFKVGLFKGRQFADKAKKVVKAKLEKQAL